MSRIASITAEAHQLATEWLTRYGITRPPVPVYDIALQLSTTLTPVAMDRSVAACRWGTAGAADVALNVWYGDPGPMRRRRLRMAMAHELMALHLPGAAELGECVIDACARELVLYAPWYGAVLCRAGSAEVIAAVFDAPLGDALLADEKRFSWGRIPAPKCLT